MNVEQPNSPSARDAKQILHPFTNCRTLESDGALVIERGEGIYVYDDAGTKYIEALAGLWSVAVGFGEKRLVDAATAQLNKLPYYHTFAQKSNDPIVELSDRLLRLAPRPFSRIFFTNSGSEANDTVLKLVWYYNNARGRPEKKKIVSRLNAYHGSTIGSGSLTGIPRNHIDFDLPIANILHTACPHHYRHALDGESEAAFTERLIAEFEEMVLEEGPETVAAFIGEPVMASGGVFVPPEGYWPGIQAVCRKYDILVIADEVITGFGRTGTMFASELFGIEPDILVVSKQLTSSYIPMAALMITDELYQGIADNSAELGVLAHGITASGHPVAAAVANECLSIIEEKGLVENAVLAGRRLQDGLRRFASHPLVGEVRGVGLIAAVEFVRDKQTKAEFERRGAIGLKFFELGHTHGLIVRNIFDSVALCPPLIISEAEVDELLERFGRTLEDTYAFARDNGHLD